jgi:phytoene/squalene synthetase
MPTIFSKSNHKQEPGNSALAEAITKASSAQTYYTIRFLADGNLAPDAYRAYAYFRWLDDILDATTTPRPAKLAFVERQQALLENGYLGDLSSEVCPEEQMLLDLIRHDQEKNSGLQSYLRNMMAVMVFDVDRCGRQLSRSELAQYSRFLSTAVTDAMHYFIGHDAPSPQDETRYLAVMGAHVVHMLRDTLEDTASGYINIPLETMEARSLSAQDLDSPLYRAWVCNRVQLAQLYFKIGRQTVARVKNLRCRLAGFAYIARFEWLLRSFEQDGYRLRAAYPERKSLPAAAWMLWRTLASAFAWPGVTLHPSRLASQPVRNQRS